MRKPLTLIAAELRVLVGNLKRRMRAEAHLGDYTASQKQVLMRLEIEGKATVTMLAQGEGVRPQSMGETLSALKSAGLVAGAPDPGDGRQTILSLTPAGRQKIKAARAAKEDWLVSAMRSQLSVAEQKQLVTGIKLLQRLVNS